MAVIYILGTSYCIACWALWTIITLISRDKGYDYWLNWIALPFAPIIVPWWILKQL